MMESPTAIDPALYGHSRSRTTSSNVFPSQQGHQQQYQQNYQTQQRQPQNQHYSQYQQQQQHQQQLHPPPHPHPHQQHQQQHKHPHPHPQSHPHQHHQPQMHPGQQHHHQQQPSPHSASNPQLWRRSPSIGAFSSTSSFQQPPPAAYRTSSSDLRRSTSSRSVAASTHGSSYVALLRRQKATVWCDRAQYEDPRALAQQRAAKMRANLEVISSNNGRTQTGLASTKAAGKIRHGKTVPVASYAPGETHVGVGGVPLRLSAREIGDDASDDDDNTGPMMAARANHRRAGSSGRSSTGSGRQGHQHRTSSSGTPARLQSLAGTPERTESLPTAQQSQPPPPQQQQQAIDGSVGPTTDDAASGKAGSSRSGNSATPSERRDDILELGSGPKLAVNSRLNSALTREKSVKSPEELKRRGSVDERTATLTSGRLFIANPD